MSLTAEHASPHSSDKSEKERICRLLDERGIAYERVDHPPMATVDDMLAYKLQERGSVAKNLFLRDAKGKRHFLLVLRWDKKADLQAVRDRIGSTRLSFASDERLMRYLGVRPGSVSPLGILNDESHAVAVYFDSDLASGEIVGIHPNDNTATIYLAFDDLACLLRSSGAAVSLIDIASESPRPGAIEGQA